MVVIEVVIVVYAYEEGWSCVPTSLTAVRHEQTESGAQL